MQRFLYSISLLYTLFIISAELPPVYLPHIPGLLHAIAHYLASPNTGFKDLPFVDKKQKLSTEIYSFEKENDLLDYVAARFHEIYTAQGFATINTIIKDILEFNTEIITLERELQDIFNDGTKHIKRRVKDLAKARNRLASGNGLVTTPIYGLAEFVKRFIGKVEECIEGLASLDVHISNQARAIVAAMPNDDIQKLIYLIEILECIGRALDQAYTHSHIITTELEDLFINWYTASSGYFYILVQAHEVQGIIRSMYLWLCKRCLQRADIVSRRSSLEKNLYKSTLRDNFADIIAQLYIKLLPYDWGECIKVDFKQGSEAYIHLRSYITAENQEVPPELITVLTHGILHFEKVFITALPHEFLKNQHARFVDAHAAIDTDICTSSKASHKESRSKKKPSGRTKSKKKNAKAVTAPVKTAAPLQGPIAFTDILCRPDISSTALSIDYIRPRSITLDERVKRYIFPDNTDTLDESHEHSYEVRLHKLPLIVAYLTVLSFRLQSYGTEVASAFLATLIDGSVLRHGLVTLAFEGQRLYHLDFKEWHERRPDICGEGRETLSRSLSGETLKQLIRLLQKNFTFDTSRYTKVPPRFFAPDDTCIVSVDKRDSQLHGMILGSYDGSLEPQCKLILHNAFRLKEEWAEFL